MQRNWGHEIMLLYRIRRKDNGRYFGGLAYPWNIRGHERWNDSGAFFRDIDTIAAWLKVICGDWKKNKKKLSFRNQATARRMADALQKYDRKLLKNYEVVINNVTVRSEKTIEAKDLVK